MENQKRYAVHDTSTNTYEHFDSIEEVKIFLDEVPWAITLDTKTNETILPWELL